MNVLHMQRIVHCLLSQELLNHIVKLLIQLPWKVVFIALFHYQVLDGCRYTQRSQQKYFTKRLWNLFSFFTFSYKRIFEWNLLQLVIKNTYSCPNRSHVLCESLLNKYEFFKMCRFCQILCFILKIYHVVLNHTKTCQLF